MCSRRTTITFPFCQQKALTCIRHHLNTIFNTQQNLPVIFKKLTQQFAYIHIYSLLKQRTLFSPIYFSSKKSLKTRVSLCSYCHYLFLDNIYLINGCIQQFCILVFKTNRCLKSHCINSIVPLHWHGRHQDLSVNLKLP